ncbi:peptidase domain-containing ABC transporter [Methylobacterium sp. C25]|uniref:peptidase domain-containing ABC transporter n=1 Tax=Methylobacterium sp. C25 TaxID=2721622 RepID=UPI003FA36C62|nr:peptidase domain-containing ABC transporter [Methylobacterium sp. C25]
MLLPISNPADAPVEGCPNGPDASVPSEVSKCSTSLDCLSFVARSHGIDLSPDHLTHRYALTESEIPVEQLLRMAKDAGLRARSVRLRWRDLCGLREAFPAMIRLENGNWVVLLAVRADDDSVDVLDPLADRIEPIRLPKAVFLNHWKGSAILLKRGLQKAAGPTFGFRWFTPELLRQKRLLTEVALAAILLYALGLATPIFFQIIIDKVLVHESYATLYVLSIGIVIALVFDAAFTYLRRYLMLYATCKIDVRVSTRTFAHLLALPIGFFEKASSGLLVKHMQQAGRIREFLTGKLFMTALDALSLFVFVPILLLYSVKLTSIVLGFAVIVAVIVASLLNPFRRRLRELYEAEGARQSLLVETVHGMATVKSLSMEPLQGRAWDDRSAESASGRFGVEKISTAAQALTGLVEKLLSVAIISLGAFDVFNGEMTIGALVAFNMLAGRVSGPLVQIVTMTQEYQEVALSVRMLGEIMSSPREHEGAAKGLHPPINGSIAFEGVTFRYSQDASTALDDVSFEIPAGSVFGIVGRSGSGKTTITRLIQRLHRPQAGVIRIGGVDSRDIDLVHLRRSVGVVLQDNFLFHGTVRENIAAAKAHATLSEVARVAFMAGATEFIERLPRGFDTVIEEGGANLSGGQRQRLAIARALITDPPILIFDEATSALDPESELVIRQNLRAIAAGRTVIIVSHRLGTLVGADAILVIERGRLVDQDRHNVLLTRCTTYRRLWNQQARGGL